MAANNREQQDFAFYHPIQPNNAASPSGLAGSRADLARSQVGFSLPTNPFLLYEPESNLYQNQAYSADDYPLNPNNFSDAFSRLNLSTPPNQSRFQVLTGGAGGSYLLDPQMNMRVTDMDLQRMRVEAAVKGQLGLLEHLNQNGLIDDYTYNNQNYKYNTYDNYSYNNRARLLDNGMISRSPPLSNRGGSQSSHDLFNGTAPPRRDRSRFDNGGRFGYQNSSNYMNSLRNNGNGMTARNSMNSMNSLSIRTNGSNAIIRNNGNNNNYRASRRGIPNYSAPEEVVPNYSTLEEVRGKICRLAKEKPGSDFLKGKIEGGKGEEIEMIFVEVKDYMSDLMMDQYGNFLVQKLFEVCNDDQMNQIVGVVICSNRNFLDICLDGHGTRAVQKLMEHLNTHNQRLSFLSELKHITLTLTKNINGHHVINHCFDVFSKEEMQQILEVVAENCLEIATDTSGCCVMQQCVSKADGNPRRRLVDQIISNTLVLSENAYGNYVVQYVLGLGVPQYTRDIVQELAGSFVSLTLNKCGSHVVEKCLKESGEDQSSQIISELIESKDFLMILTDPFGNYVAQRALDVPLAKHDKQKLINAINEHYAFIHCHPHGKKVLLAAKRHASRISA